MLISALKNLISNDLINQQEKEKDDEIQLEKLMMLMSTDCNGFKSQCIGYVSGFILRMVARFINCDVCRKGCLAEYSQRDSTSLDLFDYKQRGPLQVPSKDVTTICKTTENAIVLLLKTKNLNSLMKEKTVNEKIITMVMRSLETANMFSILKTHQLEVAQSVSIFDDHILKLFRTIILCYTKIKFFHCIRVVNETKKQAPLYSLI